MSFALVAGFVVLATGAPVRHADPHLTAERVEKCGFAHVRVKDEPDLQEQVVEVTGALTATDMQLRCVAQHSIAGVTYVEFPAPIEANYQRVYSEIEKAIGRIEARKWLEKKGLLTSLPTYEPGKTDAMGFARRLESLCGPKARGAFVREHGTVTVKVGTIDKPALDNATFECLLNATAASDFPFGFIGNEYYSTKAK